jgi:hypothetical protein
MTRILPLLLLLASTPAGADPARALVLPLQHAAPVTPARAAALRAGAARALGQQISSAEVDRRLAATDPTCTSSSCLAEAARVLGAEQLVGGRLALEPGEVWTISLWLFDARQGATVGTLRDQCGGCSDAEAARWAGEVALRLRQESQAEEDAARIDVRSVPAGAQVSIDGTPVGVAGMAFGVAPGRHTVTLQLAGYRLSVHEVQVRPGATAAVQARLEQEPPAPAEPGSGFFSARVFKWVALGVGAAGLASGIALLALHGQETCDRQHDFYRCEEVRDTLAPGVALTVVGALAAGASAYLFYRDHHNKSTTNSVAPAAVYRGFGINATLRY